MSNKSQNLPIIYYDQLLQNKYASCLEKLDCDSMGIPLHQKFAHFLIPPDLGVYCWDPNVSPKIVYEEIRQFRDNFPNRLIILENAPNPINTSRNDIFCGLQMKIWLECHDHIQPALTTDNTCMILKSLATRLQIKDAPPSMNRPKTNTDLRNQHLNFLEGLIGTGIQKAEILLDHFGSALDVIRAIEFQPNLILNIKGFGPEFIETNNVLLSGKNMVS